MKFLTEKRPIIQAWIGGKPAAFLLDTGASVGIIDREFINEYALSEGRRYNGTIVGAAGAMRKVRYCDSFIDLDNGKQLAQFLLADISNVRESIEAETGIAIVLLTHTREHIQAILLVVWCKLRPNWRNPDYVNSYSKVSGATQTFSYYGATAIGIFDMGVDIITLPKDCRGLMYHAPAITHAGVFDAKNATNFGAKKGSWQEAFGDCISLTSLYIQNLKASINISWSPINIDSMEFIINNAANTSKITISVSPYTWYRLPNTLKEAASAKNITIALLEGNYYEDARLKNAVSEERVREIVAEMLNQ